MEFKQCSSERGIHSRASDMGGSANARGGVLSLVCTPPNWLLEELVHYVGIDQALRGMVEHLGERTHDAEAEGPPQRHRAVVGADHEVELHGLEAKPAR